VIYRFRIEHMLAPGHIIHRSKVELNNQTYTWSSSPDPGGYHIGRNGWGFWTPYVHTDGEDHWILYDTVQRGGNSVRAGHAMVISELQMVIGFHQGGATGVGHVFTSAVPAFRGEVLWTFIP